MSLPSSGVINRDALDASLTTFRAVFEELFTSAAQDDVVAAFCQEISNEGGLTAQLQFQDTTSNWRQFLSAREAAPTRVSTVDITVLTYEQTLQVSRREMKADKVGLVGQRIRQFLAGAATIKSQLLHEFLALNSGAGPACYDGQYLLSTAHPNAPGATTQSNLGTTALSNISFETAYTAMTSFLRENGEPFGVIPKFLVVGPKNRRMAMDICKNDLRVVGFAATSLEAGTTVAAAAVGNNNNGIVTALIDERLVGTMDDYWYLVGSDRSGQSKPIVFVNATPVTEQLDVDPNSPTVMATDKLTYGLIADCAFGPGAWPCIWGGIL